MEKPPLGEVPHLRVDPESVAGQRSIEADPELWHGLTITGPQLGAQVRAYGPPEDREVRLALAVLDGAWEAEPLNADRPVAGRVKEISSLQAVRLRDLLNIATARGYLP